MEQAILQAREEGKFQGQVVQSLADIKNALETMHSRHREQNEKIESKANKEDLDALREIVSENSKKLYMAVGAVAFLQVTISLIGLYLTYIK